MEIIRSKLVPVTASKGKRMCPEKKRFFISGLNSNTYPFGFENSIFFFFLKFWKQHVRRLWDLTCFLSEGMGENSFETVKLRWTTLSCTETYIKKISSHCAQCKAVPLKAMCKLSNFKGVSATCINFSVVHESQDWKRRASGSFK